MVFVLAPDSFKGSLSAQEVCDAMEQGIKSVFPEAVCIKKPMADGGEGTVQAVVAGRQPEWISKQVTGPLGNPVVARYALVDDKKTAVLEMASASGMQWVSKNTMNPLRATTYGTGELIKDCLDRKVSRIIIGVGGSATNDGGAGMAQALGVKFLDSYGTELPWGGAALRQLEQIDLSGIDRRLEHTEVWVACDVSNPLLGKEGASAVFAPQKGATPGMVQLLEEALVHYVDVIRKQLSIDIGGLESGGAAGGLASGLYAFANARLVKGIDLVMEQTNFRQAVEKADWIFTGEGHIDAQTRFGKTPLGVAQVAKEYGKSVIAFAGGIGSGIEELYGMGIRACFCVLPGVMPMEKALTDAGRNIRCTVENVVRLLL